MKQQPFAILCIALALGIVLGSYCQAKDSLLWIILGTGILILIWLRIWNKASLIFSLVGFIIVCAFGLMRYHHINLTKDFVPKEDKTLVEVKVSEVYKPSSKYNKYKARIIKSQDTVLIGQHILLYVKKFQPILHDQDRALFYTQVYEIQTPKNPHTFNYNRFMALKKVHLQCFNDSILSISHPQNFSLPHEFSKFKLGIKQKLQRDQYSKAAQLFVSSLALGDRTNFDKETQKTLTSVGIVHLFAISGLHLGIMFSLVMLLLYPLLYVHKGKSLRIVAALVIIWLYTTFIDFTPSVTRAAFMITVYYSTVLLQRPTNLMHSLFFTAFILLCINPNYLFDVGFQLSYAAVFFIAWLYQPIRHLLPKYRKRRYNYIYDLIAVTLAAQLGVMPISIFYFHQFSGLFIVGNLLMIPLAMTLVIISMLVIVAMGLDFRIPYGVNIVNHIFDFIYYIIEKISTLDGLIFRNLSLSIFQLILCLSFVFLLRNLLMKYKWYKLIPIMGLVLAFQLSRLYQHQKFQQKEELLVFNQYKGSIIGLRKADNMDIFWDVEDSIQTYTYIISPYVTAEKINNINIYPIHCSKKGTNYIKEKQFIKWNNTSFYIVVNRMDSLPNADYIIGTKGKVNPKTKISAQTKRVIADASNYPSVIKRLKENSNLIYATADDGAYIFTTDSINH